MSDIKFAWFSGADEYEYVVLEIYLNGVPVIVVNRESGLENLGIELCSLDSGGRSRCVFSLDVFSAALDACRRGAKTFSSAMPGVCVGDDVRVVWRRRAPGCDGLVADILHGSERVACVDWARGWDRPCASVYGESLDGAICYRVHLDELVDALNTCRDAMLASTWRDPSEYNGET